MLAMSSSSSSASFVSGVFILISATLGLISSRRKKREQNEKNNPQVEVVFGVVGGLGPKASAMFYADGIIEGRVRLFKTMKLGQNSHDRFQNVLQVSMAKWTEEQVEHVWNQTSSKINLSDQDHIPIIIFNNPLIPKRPEFILGFANDNPLPALVDTAENLLEAGANRLCMICNTAHYFKNEIIKSLDLDTNDDFFLDMIETTLLFVQRISTINTKQVGLLATKAALLTGVFRPSPKLNIEWELVSPLDLLDGNQDNIEKAIFSESGIKAGFDSLYDGSFSHEALQNLNLILSECRKMRKQGIRTIILGCSELPLLVTSATIQRFASKEVKDDLSDVLFVDPSRVLADEVLRLSLINRIIR